MKDDIYNDVILDAAIPDSRDLIDQIEWLNDELRSLKKKRKKKKKGKSKGKKKKIKKLNKRIRKIENKLEKLSRFFWSVELKPQKHQANLWWQDAMVNSLPQFFEFATAAVNRLPAKTQPQRQTQLYLEDKEME